MLCKDGPWSCSSLCEPGANVTVRNTSDFGGARSMQDMVTSLEDDKELEPHNGIEFNSHEEAYAFYQEYARSMGFTTSIKNSRRSKKSKEFIDAKFACSRYGATPESDGGGTRRSGVRKTDCKASMHVKRRPDGKWIIHDFIKEHNHELLPALAYHFRIHRNVRLVEKNNIDILHAVSERTRKMFVEMSRESNRYQNPSFILATTKQIENDNHLVLESGDARKVLEYFKHVKKRSPNFLYAIDLNRELQLRNLFWVDAKSRDDYISFNDAVYFDTFYMKHCEKLPFAAFLGVNHHCQPLLLGCAILVDESSLTFTWVMRSWLRAMGGVVPKVIITDLDTSLRVAVEEVFPESHHCYALWNLMEKISLSLSHVINRHPNFPSKFNKCVFNSQNEEQFDMRWWKMVMRFELQDDECIRSLYRDRKKWVPTHVEHTFLAGISATHRVESTVSFLDQYIHKKTTLMEFMKQYGILLRNSYEEEAVADFDTTHKQPVLWSPSPWEKQMATIYTLAIFKKFQVEVLGVVGCHPRKEREDASLTTFSVQDCEKDETFLVSWHKMSSEVSCSCHMFEYKGFLCRHALVVLQICGLSTIPARYILKRWTRDAKSSEHTSLGKPRARRYNDLCALAVELSKEGSLSEDSYDAARRTLVEVLKTCVLENQESCTVQQDGGGVLTPGEVEDNHGGFNPNSTRRKNPARKRKVHSDFDDSAMEGDDIQQMERSSSDAISLNNFCVSKPGMHGSVQLNLMDAPHNGYYINHPTLLGLGQLNVLTHGQDAFFGTQQNAQNMGHYDFRSSTSYSLQEEQNFRSRLEACGDLRS